MEITVEAGDPPSIRRISQSLYLFEDMCNVYLIVRGNRAILIDSGTGRAANGLATLGVEHVDWALHTHFHRDQCDGAADFIALGAKIGAPSGEMNDFAAGSDRTSFYSQDTYDGFAGPIRGVTVDRALVDYETFTWQDVKLKIIPAPGHTKGSVALVGEIDGRRVAFSGDAIHISARPWTVFDLEWGYGTHEGVVALSLTLQTLAGLSLDVMFPSHGGAINAPSAACNELLQRLESYHDCLQPLMRFEPLGSVPLSGANIRPITPHLWMNATAFANTYAIVTDAGKAMFLDCGFPSHAHFSADRRFGEHSLDGLRRLAGLKEIDALLPSNYQDDHVCGLQYLHEQYGARLWVFERQEDILARPEAYRFPRLWRRPMTPSRVFQDGESFRWEGIAFTAIGTPGHAKNACAVSFEIDGRRYVHAGDTIGRVMAGPTLGGPVFHNGCRPDDFLTSVTKLRDLAPDYILTGHWGALQPDGAFFDEALRQAQRLNDVLWDLVAVPDEAGFSFDPNWATLYPYHVTTIPDEPTPIEVRIVNHLSSDAAACASFRLPVGWSCDPSDGEVTIPRGGQGVLPFLVTAPASALSDERYVIAAEVTLNGRRFGPVAEGIILLR